MIDKRTFTREWIEDRSAYFKKGKSKGNSELIEKVINALYLLEQLVSAGINLIFKGGTSLILLLDIVHRFSIDIDIILQDDEGLEELLDSIIEDNYIFHKYEKNERKNTKGIPKAHYKFYFTSVHDDTEKYILLDVIFEKNPYKETVVLPIESIFLISDGEPISVVIPSIDCILGDKLTAFAPNTTGIQYGVGKELEIIKQLFDVGNLFDRITNLDNVRETFMQIAQNELNYRNRNDIGMLDVLNDIYETSFIITMRGAFKAEEFKQLELGVKRVRNHIFSRSFNIEEALLCASKAAYCSMLLNQREFTFKKFDKSINLSEEKIELDGFTKYYKSLKKITPEGFFYWEKAIALRNKTRILK